VAEQAVLVLLDSAAQEDLLEPVEPVELAEN
jgi:hypothetical protein